MANNNPFLEATVTRRDARKFQEVGKSWNVLQNTLNVLDEETLVKMLKWEMDNQRRIHFLNRIKSRHNRLRDQRERRELFEEMNDEFRE
jgi:hypothetical protein